MRRTILLLSLAASLVFGCSAGGTAVATNAPAPANTPAPTDPTVAGTGKITFGTDFDKDTLLISKPKKTFPKGVKKIAWSAQFVEPAGVTTLHLVFAKVGKGGSESIVDSSNVGISNPALDLVASKADLAGIAGHKVGVYRLRYLGGDRVLAEGTFRLVK